MTAEPTVDHRRIAIARARLDTWTRHQRMLGVEPGRLEALAGAITVARAALEDLENAAGDRAAARRRLGVAMEQLRLAVDTLGRGIAHRAIAREEHAMACGDDDTWTEADGIHTEAGACPQARSSRRAAAGRPAIVAAGVDELGRVRLHMSCFGLGRDPSVRVLVRRRVGRRGVYEPIGYARGSTYVDRNPKRVGRYAAYKVEVVRGPMAGATSRRALADFRESAPPARRSRLHLEPAAPAMESAGARVALRAA